MANLRMAIWTRIPLETLINKSKNLVFSHSKVFTIMYLKSPKYSVNHIFVYYNNQLFEVIYSKKVMQTRYFYIVNFWIHLQYIFTINSWLRVIPPFFLLSFFITETRTKKLALHQLYTDLRRLRRNG